MLLAPVLTAGLSLTASAPASAAPVRSAVLVGPPSALLAPGLAAAKPKYRTKKVRYNSRGAVVKKVQRKLRVRPVSGWFGPLTRAAVIRFQKRTPRIAASGVVGYRTYRALGIAVPRERVPAKKKASSRTWVKPVSGYVISARYGAAGNRWSRRHTGLDFATPAGRKVRSVAAGRVISAGWAGAYGYRVVVKHANGDYSWYCHLSRITKRGGKVKGGQSIGRVGATGNVTGPHLHLEIRTSPGKPVAPGNYLRERGVRV